MAERSQSPETQSGSKAEAEKEDEPAADFMDEDALKKEEEGWTDEEKEEHRYGNHGLKHLRLKPPSDRLGDRCGAEFD